MKKLLLINLLLLSVAFAQMTKTSLSMGISVLKTKGISHTEWHGDMEVRVNTNHLNAAAFGNMLFVKDGDAEWTPDYDVGIDAGYQMDPFKLYAVGSYKVGSSMSLRYRINAGVGGKFTYIHNNLAKMSISLIPMYNREGYVDVTEEANDLRLSLRHKMVFKLLNDTIGLKSVIFYKPLVSGLFEKYAICTEHVLYFLVTGDINFELKHKFDLDVNKGYGIQEDKTHFIAGIKITI